MIIGLSTYLPTLPTLPTYLPTLPTLPTYLPTYLPYLPTYPTLPRGDGCIFGVERATIFPNLWNYLPRLKCLVVRPII